MHEIEAKSILSARGGMNLYRGCTHGCIYCDSRSACYGMDHAFEDVAVKRNAPELLDGALRRRRSRCMIGTGAMSDPYLPLEAELGLTRRCLEIIDRHAFGCTVLTKSDLVLRDLDVLGSIARRTKCVVQMTLTTFDEALCRVLEPRVCTTARRIEVLHRLKAEGIPTVVWLCPILPFLNDTPENLRGLLDACFSAGVRGIVCFGMGVTLRDGNRQYFYAQLDRHFPGLRQRYERTFGSRYSCESPQQGALMRQLEEACGARGVPWRPREVFAWMNAFEDRASGEQLSLF